MTETLPGTVLEAERVVPAVRLLDARRDAAVSLSDFRHRSSLALAFLHEGCPRCAEFARELASCDEDVRHADGKAFAVLTNADDLALPVLVDAEGDARERLLGADAEIPVVLVLDRYGAAWRSYPAAGHDFPPGKEVAATLWHLALMCPECGPPTW